MIGDQQHTGGIAAGHKKTAEAAAQILEAGGNAFDAALGGFLAACVAEPVLASLGGGGFLVAKPTDGDVSVHDFFTGTPLSRPNREDVDFQPILADFGTTTQEFHIGLGSVAVPGAVAGIFAVHEDLCRMPLSDIAAPAIALARTGVRITAYQAQLLEIVGPIYRWTPECRARFCANADIDAPLKGEGELIAINDFAGFLDTLMREGRDMFYKGDVAGLIEDLDGCTVRRADLEAYEVIKRRPIDLSFRGHRVFLNPPPAIGGALINLTLRFLDTNLPNDAAWGEAAHVRPLVDAFAFCDQLREESGIDLDPIRGAELLADVDGFPPAYRGTTHISVADRDGNIAALTVSNGEGCGHILPRTGVMLNNMLGEEDLNAAGFFQWQPGVRMSSMMTPGLISAPGGAWSAFGSGGSNRIRTAIPQVVLNLVGLGMGLDAAISAARIHLEKGLISVEPGFPEAAQAVFEAAEGEFHPWPEKSMFFGGVHVVTRYADGAVEGAGDPRRSGTFRPV